MQKNGAPYLIFELEDSGQPVQGFQPKNNNNGKAQMFVILLASVWNARKLYSMVTYWSHCFPKAIRGKNKELVSSGEFV